MAMSGMEQMLHSLMKSAGIDPVQIGKQIEQTVSQIFQAMQALQLRLDAIDTRQAQIDARLERIEKLLAITDEVDENREVSQRLISG